MDRCTTGGPTVCCCDDYYSHTQKKEARKQVPKMNLSLTQKVLNWSDFRRTSPLLPGRLFSRSDAASARLSGALDQIKAELIGTPAQVAQHALAILHLVVVGIGRSVFCLIGDHAVEDGGQFVGGGGNRLGSPQTRFLTAQIAPEGAVGVGQPLCCDA
jgi:hypothetical protein